MTGMAVTVDQHAANGGHTGGFQQFSGGGEQSRHDDASTQNSSSMQLFEHEDVQSTAGSAKSGLLQPGSLHIRA
jgi:hypothetical protein